MKKFNNYLVLFLSLAVLVACNDDSINGLGEENPESGWLQFDGTDPSVTLLSNDLISEQTSTIEIPFRYTAPVNKSEIVLNYSTADVEGNSSDVLVNGSGSATIAANTLNGTITLNIDLVSLEANIANTYVFDVVMQSNNRSVGMGLSPDFSSTYRVTLKTCDLLDLAGMYSVTTNYSTHDFLPDYSTNTGDFEIFANIDGTFYVNDFSGGLYSSGPYVGAYGTSEFVVTFYEVCGEILWEGQSDYWGAVVAGDGATNSVDPDTGVITISWKCLGYGEAGVSVYTPL
jgi:hypothetical protein